METVDVTRRVSGRRRLGSWSICSSQTATGAAPRALGPSLLVVDGEQVMLLHSDEPKRTQCSSGAQIQCCEYST